MNSSNSKILKMLAGTSIAQAMPLLVAPFLTRLYTPEQFGDFGFLVLAVTILSITATLRYEMAITLPRYSKVAANVVYVVITLSFCFSILLLLSLASLQLFSSNFFDLNQFGWQILFIPVCVFLMSIFQSLYYWFNRDGMYNINATSRVLTSGSIALVQLICGLLAKFKMIGLMLGHTTGYGISSLFLLTYAINSLRRHHGISLRRYVFILKRYVDFPKYLVISSTLNILSRQSPVIFLTIFHSAMEAGYYILLQRTFAAPISVIGVAVADVFREEASRSYRANKNCYYELITTIKKLLMVSALPFILVGIYSPFLFSFIFGDDWQTAGEYARYLAPMFFLQFIASPVSSIYIITGKQREDLFLQVIALAGVSIIFSSISEIELLLVVFSTFYCLIYLLVIVRSIKMSKE